jgi:putative ABC transport system permease protein
LKLPKDDAMKTGNDLLYSARNLARAPGFTALIVLMLASGIGATTAMFSVVEGVVMRPLPFAGSERLIRICETNPSVQGFCVASPPNVRDWSRQTRTLEEVGLAREWSFVLQGDEGAEEIDSALVTPGFFRAFRLVPSAGRLLLPADLDAGSAQVVVLSHGFWQSRFAADRRVVGRRLMLDGTPYEIVGVLPQEAEIPELEQAQLWVPLKFFAEEHRSWRGFQAVGRLRPGVDASTSRSELTVLAAALAERYPQANRGWGIDVVPLHEWVVGPVRPTLLVFLSVVSFVLLIACANTTNLLLSRALARRKELAVRAAVGASRRRLVSLLLGESLLLALLGGILGILLAHQLLSIFLAAAPQGIPRLHKVTLDGPTLVFAMLLSLLTSFLCGLVPALRESRAEASQVLKGPTPGRSGGPGLGLREGLVIAEVALALVLLIGASLLTRSFFNARRWQGGFDSGRLLTVSILCPSGSYASADSLRAFYRRAVREIQALPSVSAVGAASSGSFFGGRESSEFVAEDRLGDTPQSALFFNVDPGYFRTIGVPVLRGRSFSENDDANASPVAIVNATLARRLWPGENPIGKRLRRAQGRGDLQQVIGVIADIAPLWPQREVEPEIYWPYQQQPRRAAFFLVRSESDAGGVAQSVRRRLGEIDPQPSIGSIVTAKDLLRLRLAGPRFNMLLVGLFAVIALVLALGGTYGVVSYAMARRTREIGLRMALGASRDRILRWALGEGLKLAILGTILGLVGALALTRLLEGLLYGSRATDLATYTVAVALMLFVVVAAIYAPADRAARADPMAAIRTE